MTKAQLIELLRDLPDTSHVHIQAASEDIALGSGDDLAGIAQVVIIADDGPGAPAFAIVQHKIYE